MTAATGARSSRDEHEFPLAQGEDVDDLKQRILAAAASGGAFVDAMVVGNRSVSMQESPGHPGLSLL